MKKMKSWHAAALLALTMSVIAFWGFEKGESHDFQIAKNLDVFNSIVKELDMFYVDTLDADKTIREGIDNMLYSLDPYTVYYPEDDRDELEQMLRNKYGGIGSIITWNDKLKRSVISEPYEGMPAAKVGLKVGDILMELDGEDLLGKDNQQVSEMLRGDAGTSFTLKVQRPGEEKPLTFNIVRQYIELPLIPYYAQLDNGIGYINLSTFSGNPSKEFKRVFQELKSQGITSLVIDLRNNGGGLLDEAIEIANFFVPKGQTLVTTRGKTKQASETYKTLREPLDLDIPIAVLVNSGTASSSEILAGSLQDLDRAVIVGTRTYGKGLVQTTRPLPYGGTMKVTTSKYYIPSGRCVQAIDYSHRNTDGSVGRIPDSLTTVFHTAAGREVRDGGGVSPDIVVEHPQAPNILYYLSRDNLIFDYATDYCIKHKNVAKAEEFKLTDKDYEEFKEKVKAADFKYDQQSEKLLKDLKKMAEFEGYKQDAEAEFEALEKKLQHNLDRDLDYFADDIKPLIAEEIMKRFYYQKGSIIEQLKDDPDLAKAKEILMNQGRYREMLAVKD
ncbi:MAG: S41 family peptidase [Bacteroidaceae bacterium]|nr:S41 family peptidase [Bacteroidaceae bacterium]